GEPHQRRECADETGEHGEESRDEGAVARPGLDNAMRMVWVEGHPRVGEQRTCPGWGRRQTGGADGETTRCFAYNLLCDCRLRNRHKVLYAVARAPSSSPASNSRLCRSR